MIVPPSVPASGPGCNALLREFDPLSCALRWSVEAQLTGKTWLARYWLSKAVNILTRPS